MTPTKAAILMAILTAVLCMAVAIWDAPVNQQQRTEARQ